MAIKTDDLIYHSTLRHVYGLSPAWIRRLGQPDRLHPHPRDPAKKVSLYSRRRVEAYLEAHRMEYLRMLVARAKRSGQTAAETCRRAQALMAWAKTVEITAGPLPDTLAQLTQEARASFLSYQATAGFGPQGRGQGDGAQPEDDFKISNRAILAHLRHTNTNYPELLGRLTRAPGTTLAYLILKRRVNRKLSSLLRQQYGEGQPALGSRNLNQESEECHV